MRLRATLESLSPVSSGIVTCPNTPRAAASAVARPGAAHSPARTLAVTAGELRRPTRRHMRSSPPLITGPRVMGRSLYFGCDPNPIPNLLPTPSCRILAHGRGPARGLGRQSRSIRPRSFPAMNVVFAIQTPACAHRGQICLGERSVGEATGQKRAGFQQWGLTLVSFSRDTLEAVGVRPAPPAAHPHSSAAGLRLPARLPSGPRCAPPPRRNAPPTGLFGD